MRTVYHPTFDNVSHEVSEDAVEAWRNQGWRLTKPRATETTAAATAADQGQHSDEGDN